MDEPRKHQVSLRGASAKEITRDALLVRVSQERELRNYTRRATAAALFIQCPSDPSDMIKRVWRRYNTTKMVALQVRVEWETMINCRDVPVTRKWISGSFLRPFLFFVTFLSTRHQKIQDQDINCMKDCFRILLESMRSTDVPFWTMLAARGASIHVNLPSMSSEIVIYPERNFCTLAICTSEERRLWIYQAKRLVSLSLLILGECDYSSHGGQDIVLLTSLAMRFVVILTDLKEWKCVTNSSLRDANIAVKDLVQFMCSKESRMYICMRRYINCLDPPFYTKMNSSVQADDKFLITASAITLALRPFHIANLDINGSGPCDVMYAAEQFCVLLLTIPCFAQRLPAVLLSALKHESVLPSCFRMLLTSKEKILKEISEVDQLKITSSNTIPPIGWALANVICLATGSENSCVDPGKFTPGLDYGSYICAVIILSENLLSWLESVGYVRENQEVQVNNETSADFLQRLLRETCTTHGSLKMSYMDFFRPVCQQWHLLKLLTLENSSIDNLGSLGKCELLDVAYYYCYMLKIFSILNPLVGSLPVLNMLSFTPGFLVDLWGALEKSLVSGKGPIAKDSGLCKSKISGNENDRISGRKPKSAAKDAGNKWVNVLHKFTSKSQADCDFVDSNSEKTMPDQIDEESCDVWDVEPLRRGPEGMSEGSSCLLHLFCATYSHLLLVLDDIEFYDKQVPFTLEQQQKVASVVNTLVYNALFHSTGEKNRPLVDAAVRCLHLLYERDCRHRFCPSALWLSPARKNRPPIAVAARTHEALSATMRPDDSLVVPSMRSVITTTPHVYPFEERVQMFREFISMDKVSRRMAGEVVGPGPQSVEIVIRRGHIVEDGFRQLNSLGSRLKSSIHVSFVSECGLPEAGLDYGGLSKEFLTEIAKAAFMPEYGLFSQTSTSDRLLIPNTAARVIENGAQMIEFLGRVVGKALYEGILLDYSFSHVFVQKLLGRYSFLDELSTLDPELYRNLIYVKYYDSDVKELSLDFTVTEESFGKRFVIELKPGGKDICVTNENKLQYVHAIADYKLNRQVLPLANAFYRGLTDLISPSWLKLFNASEINQTATGRGTGKPDELLGKRLRSALHRGLRLRFHRGFALKIACWLSFRRCIPDPLCLIFQLLSGGKHDIDVDDLKNYTRYSGGYTEGSRTVKLFWEVWIVKSN
ncbi:hypothetical protein RJ639_010724 [Escallonia herrerae]|uniref:HECT-type E3 ubiquitin transferase n=1 Tax=Escallonia herrerae TaxID=1293975 RepID=A0AA89APF0_9ASTE|nr:hypothetical protein RJ639_010724 [Escallonia herrerae]